MRSIRLVGFGLLLLGFGCASGVSQQSRSQVTYHGSFSALQHSADSYQGNVVMFGGKVIETKSDPTFSEIVVLQLPLGSKDKPKQNGQSEGRFLIRSDQFLDPAVYRNSSLVTVVGRLGVTEVRSVGDFPYTYPVIHKIELKSWPYTVDTSPNVHFGIGVGTTF